MRQLKKTTKAPRILSTAELDRIRGGGDLATAPEDEDPEAARSRNGMALILLSSGVP